MWYVQLALAGNKALAWQVYRNETYPEAMAYAKILGKISDSNIKIAEETHEANDRETQQITVLLVVIGLLSIILLISYLFKLLQHF